MTITRRQFLKGSSALALILGTTSWTRLLAEEIAMQRPERTIVGYGYPWTVRPGGNVDFMYSTYAKGDVEASLVRIHCMDGINEGMYEEEALHAPFAGRYDAMFQDCYTGSYMEIPANDQLDDMDSVIVEAHAFPTLLPSGDAARGDGFTSSGIDVQDAGIQTLVARYNTEAKKGWLLAIDANHRPVFIVEDGNGGREMVTIERKLYQDRWFKLRAEYDAKKGLLRLSCESASIELGHHSAWPAEEAEVRITKGFKAKGEGPLRFAACSGSKGNGDRLQPRMAYTGKLEGICLRGKNDKDVIGCWDFSKGIGVLKVHDTSGNNNHGVCVNVPELARTGVSHDMITKDWTTAPHMYSAAQFHKDALMDAEWKPAFNYTIPDDLPSGIYAVKLVQAGTSEDYIPFIVAPKVGRPTSKAALCLPTFNNLAYSNLDLQYNAKRMVAVENGEGKEILTNEEVFVSVKSSDVDNRFLQTHPEIGRGLYRAHDDGSQCQHASMKHPNMTAKSFGILYTLSQDTYLTQWARKKGIEIDIITDELLDEEGADLLKQYNVVMTGNHPEYLTHNMMGAWDDYMKNGGRMMYLGGNGFYQVTSRHKELPHVIEVRRGGHHPYDTFDRVHAFDGKPSGSWGSNGRPPQGVTGVGMDGMVFHSSVAYDRLEDSSNPRAAFIFDGVDDQVLGDFGLLGGGAAGQEVDRVDYSLGTPRHALHLARSQDFPDPITAQWGMVAEKYRDNFPMPRADVTFFENPNGGAAFSVGSMAWVGSLSHNGYDNNISKMTENVLRRFMDDEPIPMPNI